MVRQMISTAVAGVLGALLVSAAPVSQSGVMQGASQIQGDYIEARTASVFAGPCHYNAEYMVTGRDAVMAWHFTAGSFHGASLAGLKVMAAIASPGNLADNDARRSEITIDSSATPVQRAAVIALLNERYGAAMGNVIAIHDAPISFRHDGSQYVVSATGFAALKAESMPNDECCKMPSDVWYTPLITLNNRKVGYTTAATYTSGLLGAVWERDEENSAFYGSFSI